MRAGDRKKNSASKKNINIEWQIKQYQLAGNLQHLKKGWVVKKATAYSANTSTCERKPRSRKIIPLAKTLIELDIAREIHL